MKLTPQEILSSEYGENVENRQHGQKYGNYANILEELLLKKVPPNLHDLFNEAIYAYDEYLALTFIEFESFVFKFLRKTFNPKPKKLF